MSINKFFIFISLLFVSKDSFGYLDPASGNAIICLIISLFGAVFFYLKSFLYKILGFVFNKPVIIKNKIDRIVLFSEGKNYFLTFKPIIEELIDRKIHFTYLTMGIEDPALRIDNPFMNSRYIGLGNRAYSLISSYRADIMLSTTPNLGCHDFPIKRSKQIKQLVHIWHSVCDTSFYTIGALDHYDVALTVGPWVKKTIREIEQIRNIPRKQVIPCGVPYLDEMKKKLESYSPNNSDCNSRICILIAPSWGEKNCLRYFGTDFIKKLANKDFDIIVRPHPQSLKVEKDFIAMLQDKFCRDSNVTFDFDSDGLNSMIKSSMLISDKSSMRFDYAILFEKPVLTLDIPQSQLKMYESSLLKEHFEEDFADKFGIRLDLSRRSEIIETVDMVLSLKSDYIKKINSDLISNFGSSSKAIVDYLEQFLDA